MTAASAGAAQAAGFGTTALRRAFASAGPQSGAFVRDLTTGATVYSIRGETPRIPASVEKLLTTATALRRFGPASRLHTDVVAAAPPDAARRITGDIVLVGGGDPTLDRAGLERLAGQLAATVRNISGSVVADASLFDDRPGGPRTGFLFDTDLGGVLGALTVDRGFARGAGPALGTATTFSRLLRRRGVRIAGRPRTGRAGSATTLLAQVESVPMATIVARTNTPSDNFYAETLLKDLGARFAGQGTTPAGAGLVREEVSALGIEAEIRDGSGLSRGDRIAPRAVVDLLTQMRRDPVAGAPFDASLAVMGRTGTLARRLRGTPAAGNCHAKTGTLDGVSSLAGYCAVPGTPPLAFALMMNGVVVDRARRAQDRAVAALVRDAVTRPAPITRSAP